MRNTKIEKSLNRKMRPCYLGPLIIVSCNYEDAYILSELNGTVLHRPVATFRVIPYFARKSIPLPKNFIDIDTARLQEFEMTNDIDGDNSDMTEEPSDDALADSED